MLLPSFLLLNTKLGSLQAEALPSEVPNARRFRTLPVIIIRKTERSSCLYNPFMLDIGGVSGSPGCGNPKFVRGARRKLNFQKRMSSPRWTTILIWLRWWCSSFISYWASDTFLPSLTPCLPLSLSLSPSHFFLSKTRSNVAQAGLNWIYNQGWHFFSFSFSSSDRVLGSPT